MENHVDQTCESCGTKYTRTVFAAPDMSPLEQEWKCEKCGHLNKRVDLNEHVGARDSVKAEKNPP
jgi:uncharacterized Zn finger protein